LEGEALLAGRPPPTKWVLHHLGPANGGAAPQTAAAAAAPLLLALAADGRTMRSSPKIERETKSEAECGKVVVARLP